MAFMLGRKLPKSLSKTSSDITAVNKKKHRYMVLNMLCCCENSTTNTAKTAFHQSGRNSSGDCPPTLSTPRLVHLPSQSPTIYCFITFSYHHILFFLSFSSCKRRPISFILYFKGDLGYCKVLYLPSPRTRLLKHRL